MHANQITVKNTVSSKNLITGPSINEHKVTNNINYPSGISISTNIKDKSLEKADTNDKKQEISTNIENHIEVDKLSEKVKPLNFNGIKVNVENNENSNNILMIPVAAKTSRAATKKLITLDFKGVSLDK